MDRLPARTFERVVRVILHLEGNPTPNGSQKLRGVQEYRLRVGQYRILYVIDDRRRVVEVMAVEEFEWLAQLADRPNKL